MSDILKVTTPLPGQETLGKARPLSQNEPNIQNIPDPSRVTKPNSQNVYSDREPGKFSPNLQSNFDKFLQMIKSTPGMTESYSKIFFSRLGSIVNSGMGEGIADEMAAYMDMLKMSEPELLNFVKNTQSTANKFNGVFFDMLRFVLKNSTSSDLKGAVSDFLKKYDSLTGGNHILNNMISNLKNISTRIPRQVSVALNALIDKLVVGNENGEIKENLNVLKEEIIPYLSRYISQTKDFGPARDIINMLVLNLAKYEMGSKETFLKSFKTLVGFSEIKSQLEGVPIAELEQFLLSSKGNNYEGKTEIADKLISIITRGMGGEAGYENKQIFQNILSSALINESVYMPLVHLMIPADINGKLFFSELWVDPNHEQDNGRDNDTESIKMLIKFDIKNLGYFEMVLLAKGNSLFMELYYPEKLQSAEKEIREEITNIVESNDFSFKTFFLEKCTEPKTISEVFPKIYEGRNVVNVTI
ncbi:hypothetical protein [Anaerovorax odorimutans]|uniref:hypothetical protein n=1 Tax=Anaerovorax odorimutans TaxID=109327 RepID=UPI00040884CE|nr:hypothetical protein [Anaerovorax odorimutans]